MGRFLSLGSWVVLALVYVAAGFCHAQQVQPGCRRGYVEVGRQAAADELIVYCSTVPCDQILTQVKKTFEILGKIEGVEATGDPDLRAWHEQNEQAQTTAVRAAAAGIDRSIAALRGLQLISQIRLVENEQGRLAFAGVAGGGDSRKLLAFKKAVESWEAAVNGAGRPAMSGSAMESWLALGDWVNRLAASSAVLAPAWQAIANDAATKTVLGRVNVAGAIAALNSSLEPSVADRFDWTRFVAAYGYDSASWQGKRRAILIAKGLPDQTQPAVCKAERAIAIDLRNENVCLARMPDPKEPEPEQRQCGGG